MHCLICPVWAAPLYPDASKAIRLCECSSNAIQFARLAEPGAVELRNEVGRAVGMDLPGTLVFDYPTPAAIAAFVFAKRPVTSAGGAGTASTSAAAPAAAVLRCAQCRALL